MKAKAHSSPKKEKVKVFSPVSANSVNSGDTTDSLLESKSSSLLNSDHSATTDIAEEKFKQFGDKEKTGKKDTKRVRRRTKGQNIGRNFICGCGKQYLSYPALYTHIKTKHERRSTVEDLSSVNGVSVSLNDGRAKVEKDNLGALDKYDNNLKNVECSMESRGFIEKIVAEEDLGILLVIAEDIRGSSSPLDGFPCYRMCTSNTPRFHPFLHLFHKLRTESLDFSVIHNAKCDVAFCLYLLGACRFFSPMFYRIMGVFFRNLRECLNEEGYRFCETFEVKIECPDDDDSIKLEFASEEKRAGSFGTGVPKTFCTTQPPRIIPKLANFFISEYLPNNCENFDLDVAVYLMLDFCKWLNKNKLSDIKIDLYDDVFQE